MALLSTEVYSGGEVRDLDGRMVVVVNNVTGLGATKVKSGGEVRDADGRRVVRTAT